MNTTPLSYTITDTVIGTLVLVGSERGLRELHWVRDAAEGKAWIIQSYSTALEVSGFFKSTIDAIRDYLAGKGPLKVPYDLVGGTPLQRMIWLAIAKIPYGETISYSSLAARVGFPTAVRAVASACGANPLPLVIGCHRVIAKDGTIGGFSLGSIETKEKLLAMEKTAQPIGLVA
jgi:AraC family transcriptional regulator of adaptative response/methylated-DNA-[protein]-cysteine methyltransferase